ncbi:acyltransferase family protein [Paramicrobacterium sp. CJ85]|uniref:acyltransferase family protein n=1 Tax=Paramicrobacterium sp. CJ85 TaxID=3445355 RepID=UPI003F60C1EF
MTVIAPLRQTAASHPSGRDSGIDLVRAACLIVVVSLHALMVGVTLGPEGPVFENAIEGRDWFVPVSWVAQIMPLFFIVGGFSTRHALAKARARGQSSAEFVADRVQRLLGPAIVMVAVVGAALLVMTLAGLPADVVSEAGFRISQPLWFLGVYLGCQALAPALIAAHERAPRLTLGLLAAGVIGVDAAAATTGSDGVSYLNLALVWLTVQQLGFWLADGRVDALPVRRRVALGAAALALLVVTTASGVYPADMYEGLNPPSAALVILGLVHLAALSIARPWLRRVAAQERVAAASAWLNARSMTVYLWHMPALIALAGLGLLGALNGALTLPEPGSLSWWATRPAWILLAVVTTVAVARLTGRWERRRLVSSTASAPHVWAASVAAVLSVIVLLIAGISVLTAIVSVLLMRLALNAAQKGPAGGRRPYQRVMTRVPSDA